jgi:hypothetical protein
MGEISKEELRKMTGIRKPKCTEMDKDVDCSWEGVKSSWAKTWRRSKPFAKYFPTVLLDGADLYISNKVEEMQESVASRLTRTRNRIKSAAIRCIVGWMEFGKKIVLFEFVKKKLDRLIDNMEQSNAGDYGNL